MTISTAHDLGAAVRDRRPDATAVGIPITDDWCRDQMHEMGITRYEAVTQWVIDRIAGRVDMIDVQIGGE